MKIKFFFLFAAMLICGLMIAQEPEHHYIRSNNFEGNMDMKARVCIDGVEQQSINILEIGVFNGNVVTDSKFVKSFSTHNYYRVNLTIGGNAPYPLTFKLYNHETGEEMLNYTITDPNGNPCEGITWSNDASLGSYGSPYTLNFVHTYKTIYPYTISETNGEEKANGWYLIASPIGDVAPTAVTNMLSNNYDLYYFDQAKEKEWINYKEGGSDAGFASTEGKLKAGTGYLYANDTQTTLIFEGTPYNENENVEVTLARDGNASFQGWNLVGNPFAVNAYIVGDRQFYIMNSDHNDLEVAERNYIEPMEGVFVIASEDGETLTFTTQAPTKGGEQLVVNLTQNRGTSIDRAIVGFGEGDVLPKFMLNENNTKLYIPQGNKDYAVVRSAGQGVLPLNFRAAKNGTYTLEIDAENMEMNFLHLIDNMTGMDVDLLQNPSYTFEATTRDYESRFKLVFASASTDSVIDAFAFFSNGNWIINNDGKATLQIVDVNGHILCNEQINGSCSKSFEAAPGVYMLRLINGDNVKVQKIVVR